MNVPNLNQETLQQILPRVQKYYPGAYLRNDLRGPGTIKVSYENFSFTIKEIKNVFVAAFDLPSRWSKAGFAIGAVFFSIVFAILGLRHQFLVVASFIGGLPGVITTYYIFRSRNKEKIEQFNNNFIDAVNNTAKE